MKIFKFNDAENTLKLRPDSFDDLYLLERVLAKGDSVEAATFRRFRPSEGDEGEQKEVVIKILLDEIELDKSAMRLRLTGKILSGRPEEFIRLGSYHTINVAQGDTIEIQKAEWKNYIIRRVKQAVQETHRPKLSVIALDDEKATLAYLRGYGIDIIAEIYSHLSKRMKESDFAKQKVLYFSDIAKYSKGMEGDILVIAGPGFEKDNFKRYLEQNGINLGKRIVYAAVSNAERSGVREAVQSEAVAKLMEQEHIKEEFNLLNVFLQGLNINKSHYGIADVAHSLADYSAGIILVNDRVLNVKDFQDVLDKADLQKVRIEIFNSDDEAGMQLANFKDIASIPKEMAL
jgi:protein pelota